MVLTCSCPTCRGSSCCSSSRSSRSCARSPSIVYTGKDLWAADEEPSCSALAADIILKDVRSPERLLDETALFLHRNAAHLPEDKRQIVEKLHHSDRARWRARRC